MNEKLADDAHKLLLQAVGQSISDALYDGTLDRDKFTDMLEDYCESPAAREHFELENNSPRKSIKRHKFEENVTSIGDLDDQIRLFEFGEKAEAEA